MSRPYAWRYVDVVIGDRTFVVIFMHAPVFSPRELARERRGQPSGYAVNVAMYRAGRCEAWVFNEYPNGEMQPGGVSIGESRLTQPSANELNVSVREPLAGGMLAFDLRLHAEAPAGPIVSLLEPTSHRWQVVMPRARAEIDAVHGTGSPKGATLTGIGYSDHNWGDVPLGTDLPGWTWTRQHGDAHTSIMFDVDGAARVRCLDAKSDGVVVRERVASVAPRARSWWGLALPTQADQDEGVAVVGTVIESSPFYARIEAGARLTEVAHFARYRQWWCRWMPYWRSARVAHRDVPYWSMPPRALGRSAPWGVDRSQVQASRAERRT